MGVVLWWIACTGGTGDGILLLADPKEGPLPLTVSFSTTGTGSDTPTWDFGDGQTAEGANVAHTYLASGRYTVTARKDGDDELLGSGAIQVYSGECPEAEREIVTGEVLDERIDEASGLVESQQNPGVLWTHNDSGDSPRFFALDQTGELLAIVDAQGIPSGDWEDMGLAQDPDTGAWLLVAGNVGDNNHERADVEVHFLEEPIVAPGQDFAEMEIDAWTIHVTYPGGQKLNCETLMVDPVTQDLYLVTKDYGGAAGVYRKPPPHEPESTTEMVLVKMLDFSTPPLTGGATTGGDFSPLGDRVVIRTYGSRAYLWRRDQAEPVDELWETDPCIVSMPFEQQSETIAFSADGQGLWSLSEGVFQPLNYVPFSQD